MIDKKLKISLYSRVSTSRQNVENQIQKLTQYSEIRNWQVVDIYRDKAISGRKKSRPELNRLKKDIKKGKINAVLVWKLDRLGRSVKDLINLIEFFDTHNCAFISYNNNIDTTTSEGRLLFHIIGAFAEFESNLISERTQLSYERKKIHAEQLNQKVRWGRKTKQNIVPYDFVKKKRNQGWSWRKIANYLNLDISYSTIRRVFQKGSNEKGEES